MIVKVMVLGVGGGGGPNKAGWLIDKSFGAAIVEVAKRDPLICSSQ